jgi:hypothetical protein
VSSDPLKPSKAERQADLALVVSYHEARLADLLEVGMPFSSSAPSVVSPLITPSLRTSPLVPQTPSHPAPLYR